MTLKLRRKPLITPRKITADAVRGFSEKLHHLGGLLLGAGLLFFAACGTAAAETYPVRQAVYDQPDVSQNTVLNVSHQTTDSASAGGARLSWVSVDSAQGREILRQQEVSSAERSVSLVNTAHTQPAASTWVSVGGASARKRPGLQGFPAGRIFPLPPFPGAVKAS